MVSALDSGASGLGSSLGLGHCVEFWARHFTLTVPLSTQVYKWVAANFMLGGNPAMDSVAFHPEVSRNTLRRFMKRKPG